MRGSLVEKIKLVRDGGHVAIEVVGEKEAFFLFSFAEELLYLPDLQGHKMGERFVEEGEAGSGADDDIQFDKPAVAAGKLANRFAVCLVEFRESPFQIAEFELEVIQYPSERQGFGDEIELRQKTHKAGIPVWPGNGLTVEGDGMSGCREGPVEDLQQARFAGAIATEKAGYGTCLKPEVDIAEDAAVAEGEQDRIGG
jgi:hypothetical protein